MADYIMGAWRWPTLLTLVFLPALYVAGFRSKGSLRPERDSHRAGAVSSAPSNAKVIDDMGAQTGELGAVSCPARLLG